MAKRCFRRYASLWNRYPFPRRFQQCMEMWWRHIVFSLYRYDTECYPYFVLYSLCYLFDAFCGRKQRYPFGTFHIKKIQKIELGLPFTCLQKNVVWRFIIWFYLGTVTFFLPVTFYRLPLYMLSMSVTKNNNWDNIFLIFLYYLLLIYMSLLYLLIILQVRIFISVRYRLKVSWLKYKWNKRIAYNK